MAYNLRYYAPWHALDTAGYVYIYELDGTDPSEGLVLMKDGIVINTNFEDWNEPILKQNARITFLNDASNFFNLLPLMSSEERQYKVQVVQSDPSEYTYFEGFINSEAVEQTYLTNRPLRLVASNYINKLQYVSPPSIETLGKQSLIDTISDTLKLTGTNSDINVNMTLCPSGKIFTNSQTALSNVYHETELFWKNNIERDNGEDILRKLLKPFDAYLYWWDGEWYIERYDDLYGYPQSFVLYDVDTSYGYGDYATYDPQYDASIDIFDPALHLNQSQNISIIPGLHEIEVKLNLDEYNTFVNNYWDPIENTTSSTELPWPYGTWLHWYESGTSYYVDSGLKRGISNTFRKVGAATDWEQGAWSSFEMTVPEASLGNTSLDIKYRWAPGETFGPVALASILSTTVDDLQYMVGFYIEIRSHESTGGVYLSYDENEDVWYVASGVSKTSATFIKEFNGEDLESPDFMAEITASIDMLDVSNGVFSSMEGDYDMIFGVTQTRYYKKSSAGTRTALGIEYFGDFNVMVSLPDQDNLLTATINKNFLNKKSIELDLFDIDNFNYKNGIWTNGPGAHRLTSTWYDDTGQYGPLSEKLIAGKFKLYQNSRQTIKSNIKTSEFLKPMSAWYDSNQDGKKFILVGYSFMPTRNEYDCVWNEFDNDTSININYE